ncbi:MULTISPECIES: hypothetical protein [unclassified Isoptericola]|uniref:hypothetical protein n=1 Tax=unclassified Isoptericola TaxID=2623355 RepID=UPI003655DEA1
MTLESLDRRGNLQLVEDSTRAFPALAINGDTLAALLEDMEEELPHGHATATVRGWLAAYEDMMAAAQRKLPYVRPGF